MGKQTSHYNKSAERLEAVIGRIFILAVIIILPLLLLDYISPLFLSHRRSKIEKKYPVQVTRKPGPYVMFGGESNGTLDSNEHLNKLGYRKNSPTDSKASGEFRVFVLGGSSVFNGEPSIPELLEKEFSQKGKHHVKVFNFGVVSSVSSMELSRILFEISDLNPDLIIMYNGGNDILSPYSYDPRPGYPFNFIVYENNPLLESDIRAYPAFTLLLYGSNLARYFFPNYYKDKFVPLDEERKKVNWGSDEWKRDIAYNYATNLIKANKIAASFGAGFIAYFQPLVYYKDPMTIEEKALMLEVEKDHCIAVRNLIRSYMEQVPNGSQFFFDLSDIYDNVHETVFKDTIHTHQNSKSMIARAIYEEIVKRKWIE